MTRYRSSQGSSLIEILVALAVISIALLGGVAMQIRALQLGQSSRWRDQAVVLAADLGERLEANKKAAIDGLYTVLQTSSAPGTPPSCQNTCSAAEAAALDLYQWQTRISAVLPNSSWAVQQTVSGNPSSYAILLRWSDDHGDPAIDKAAAAASYTAIRTVYRP